MRYYYKNSNNNYFSFKSEHPDLTPITEEEFNRATNPQPTEEQTALIEKRQLHAEKEALLKKYKYDVEQVDLFGMERDDYEEKKELCKQLVLELRELERWVTES